MEETTHSDISPELGQVPPLRVHHLLLWTALSSVFLAQSRAAWEFFYRLLQQQDMSGYDVTETMQEQVTRYHATLQVISCVDAVIAGGAMVGMVVLIRARLCSRSVGFREAGHWLLLISGGSVVLYEAYEVVGWVLLLIGLIERSQAMILSLPFYLIPLATSIFYIVAMRKTDPSFWKWLFAFLAGLSFIHFLEGAAELCRICWGPSVDFRFWEYVRGPFHFASLAAVIGVLAISIRDMVAGRYRDWLHWAGVCFFMVHTICRIVGSPMVLNWALVPSTL